MDLVLPIVVGQSFERHHYTRKELYVIYKFPIRLHQLLNDTFTVVTPSAFYKHFANIVSPILNELAMAFVDDIRKVKDFFIVDLLSSKDLLFIAFEVLVEEYKSSLVVKVNLIYYLGRKIRSCNVH
jgi:hypothetical protein